MKQRYYFSLALIVIGGMIGNAFRYVARAPQGTAVFSVIPTQVGEYRGEEILLDPVTHDVLKATSATMRRYYDAEGALINLFAGYFASQAFGSSIHSPKHCLPGGGWRIRTHEPFELHLNATVSKRINHLLIAYKDNQAVMLYWFETRAGATRSEYGLKTDLFLNALRMRATDAAFIRVTVDVVNGDVPEATDRGVRFIREFHPYIRQALPF